MRESARTALAWLRANAARYGLDPHLHRHTDVHLHVQAVEVPKEGASAGVTMAAALVSAFTGRPVRAGVAMSGEITLAGQVLPVGGIAAKVLAAHRAGLTRILLPQPNRKQVDEELGDELRRTVESRLCDAARRTAAARVAGPGRAPGRRGAAARTGFGGRTPAGPGGVSVATPEHAIGTHVPRTRRTAAAGPPCRPSPAGNPQSTKAAVSQRLAAACACGATSAASEPMQHRAGANRRHPHHASAAAGPARLPESARGSHGTREESDSGRQSTRADAAGQAKGGRTRQRSAILHPAPRRPSLTPRP